MKLSILLIVTAFIFDTYLENGRAIVLPRPVAIAILSGVDCLGQVSGDFTLPVFLEEPTQPCESLKVIGTFS
jgi:hypothetical protein